MALSTSEKALAILLGADEVLLRGKGVVARTAQAGLRASARAIVAAGSLGARAAPVAGRGALGLARRNPYVAGAAALYGAHELGAFDPVYDAIERERQMASANWATAGPTIIPELEAAYIAPVKRKISKANKAVKAGMAWLKKGS